MKDLTVSTLPNITFYTGPEASKAATYLENRNYGAETDAFGKLMLTNDYNSYWTNFKNNTFSETRLNYQNIGDTLKDTLSYMDKFKNISFDNISIDKNVIEINYDFEDDLNSNYENTNIVPSNDLIDIFVNMNEMTFNKKNYYKNDSVELKEITYFSKKYPWRADGTVIVTNENNVTIEYDFSKQFVDYKYTELAYDVSYIAYYVIEVPNADGGVSYITTDMTYEGFNTYYTYQISDINKLKDRVDLYFKQNSDAVEESRGNLKTYFISDLDTRIKFTLNTKSLGSKSIYAYINFTSDYNNWFDNVLKFTLNTSNLNNNDKIAKVTPLKKDYFNINIDKTTNVCGADKFTEEDIEFKIEDKTKIQDEVQQFEVLNPSSIKKIDLSEQTDKLVTVDLISEYDKKVNALETKKSNWINETSCNLEEIIIGKEGVESNVENINGISTITSLKTIDITNCNKIDTNFNLRKLENLKIFKAKGSSIKSFVPKAGIDLDDVTLPTCLRTLTLKNNTINELDYTPNSNLLNVTFENVDGINTQDFVKTWVDSLENATFKNKNGQNVTMLYSGLINNTNLVGINWTNYFVEDLIKLKYTGLNKFTGTIGIIGNNIELNGKLDRNEYNLLKETYTEDVVFNHKEGLTFNWELDENAFKAKAHINEFPGEDGDITFEFDDNIGGNSFLDNIPNLTSSPDEFITLKKNNENFGYEVEFDKTTIFTIPSGNTTKIIKAGDVVIYKGNRLLLVYQNKTTIYNYIKIGHVDLPNTIYDEINIQFT